MPATTAMPSCLLSLPALHQRALLLDGLHACVLFYRIKKEGGEGGEAGREEEGRVSESVNEQAEKYDECKRKRLRIKMA